jgi:hypothetical protein
MTGQPPKPQTIESCLNDYRKGLRFVLKDEQETVSNFLLILFLPTFY